MRLPKDAVTGCESSDPVRRRPTAAFAKLVLGAWHPPWGIGLLTRPQSRAR